VTVRGVGFFGLGGAVPVTPFGAWSFDLAEEEAAALLAALPDRAVLVTHSPPLGHCDRDGSGRRLGAVVGCVGWAGSRAGPATLPPAGSTSPAGRAPSGERGVGEHAFFCSPSA
jgi:hypothetical protein